MQGVEGDVSLDPGGSGSFQQATFVQGPLALLWPACLLFRVSLQVVVGGEHLGALGQSIQNAFRITHPHSLPLAGPHPRTTPHFPAFNKAQEPGHNSQC